MSLDPFGGPFHVRLPPMVIDHAVAARSQPDAFPPVATALSQPVWANADTASRSGADLLAAAQWRRPADGWRPGDRLLHPGPVESEDDVVAGLVAPLLGGASLVWWRNPGAAAAVGTMAAEQVTVVSHAIDALPPAVRVLAGAPVSS